MFLSPSLTSSLLSFLAAGPAMAQSKPQAKPQTAQEPVATMMVKLAVIDIDEIRREAAAVKDIRRQIQVLDQSVHAKIQKEDQDLRAAQEELVRQRTILAPEAFDAERSKFEQRVAEFQRSVQLRKQALDKTLNDAMGQVQQGLNEVVVEVAKDFNFTLLLRKDQTVLVAKPLEVTDEVLKRLDKRLPSVKVAAPGN